MLSIVADAASIGNRRWQRRQLETSNLEH